MSSAEATAEPTASPAPAKAGGRRKLILIGAPVLLLAALGGGAWFSGLLPRLLGRSGHAGAQASPPSVFIDVPDMIANLNTDPSEPRYIKLKARLEVAAGPDAKAAKRLMPRIVDLFQTYLRELRPGDLQGAMGTYRLREELINRADVALAPAKVRDVLFVQMIVQ
ncbi:MAG TPA: flagellar basal body-associated FliL family protein [Acetobacteraceae bacterium]|nr:flagellar basal body-associated FliL family protein [Acetobacteraceae bacterium]